MNRRDFITLAGGTAAAWPLVAAAQPAGKVVRIGLLSTSFLQRTAGVQAFKDRLKHLGYVEGRNLSVEIRDGQGRNDRLPAFAAELVGLPVDVIVTLGPYAIQAAKDATTTIPVVFTGIGANFALARSEVCADPREDDGDGRGGVLGGLDGIGAERHDDVHRQADELRRKRGQPIISTLSISDLDRKVPALDVPKVLEPVLERLHAGCPLQ